jgi:hypothetical protein
LINADPATGEVTAAAAVTQALVGEGLAVPFGRLGRIYLTPAGKDARAALELPKTPAPGPDVLQEVEPPSPEAFAARPGGERGADLDVDQRAAEVRAAWDGLLQMRRLQGDASAPAPWERMRPQWAVALALEAAGVSPMTTGHGGRPETMGYRVGPADQGVVRVEWHGPSVANARSEAESRLADCAAALTKAGWFNLHYIGPRRLRYLAVAATPL